MAKTKVNSPKLRCERIGELKVFTIIQDGLDDVSISLAEAQQARANGVEWEDPEAEAEAYYTEAYQKAETEAERRLIRNRAAAEGFRLS